jgi:hypothetical protein
MKVGMSEDFWRCEKRSGIAPGMILLWARKLDLKAGLFIAESVEVDEQSGRLAS